MSQSSSGTYKTVMVTDLMKVETKLNGDLLEDSSFLTLRVVLKGQTTIRMEASQQ